MLKTASGRNSGKQVRSAIFLDLKKCIVFLGKFRTISSIRFRKDQESENIQIRESAVITHARE